MPAVPPRTRPHRLYLYLLHPLGQPGEFEWLASANGFLPSLWQILLADAQPRPQLQRVLLSDAESWTAVDATVALTRFDSFRRLVLLHPAIDRVAGLDRYLAAAQQFFGESIAKWQRGQGASCA